MHWPPELSPTGTRPGPAPPWCPRTCSFPLLSLEGRRRACASAEAGTVMPGQQGPGAHLGSRCPSPAHGQASSPEPGGGGGAPLTLPTRGVQSLLPRPPRQPVLPLRVTRGQAGRQRQGLADRSLHERRNESTARRTEAREERSFWWPEEAGDTLGRCPGKASGPRPLRRPRSAPGPWEGWDSPLEASSVRAGRSGPSGLNRGHSMSGRHILRRSGGREAGRG